MSGMGEKRPCQLHSGVCWTRTGVAFVINKYRSGEADPAGYGIQRVWPGRRARAPAGLRGWWKPGIRLFSPSAEGGAGQLSQLHAPTARAGSLLVQCTTPSSRQAHMEHPHLGGSRRCTTAH